MELSEKPPQTSTQLKPHIPNSAEYKGAASSPLIPHIQPPLSLSLSLIVVSAQEGRVSQGSHKPGPRPSMPAPSAEPTPSLQIQERTEPLPATPSQPPPFSEPTAPPSQTQHALRRQPHFRASSSHPPTPSHPLTHTLTNLHEEARSSRGL